MRLTGCVEGSSPPSSESPSPGGGGLRERCQCIMADGAGVARGGHVGGAGIASDAAAAGRAGQGTVGSPGRTPRHRPHAAAGRPARLAARRQRRGDRVGAPRDRNPARQPRHRAGDDRHARIRRTAGGTLSRRAAPLRTVGRAALGGAFPGPLAAGRGGLPGKRGLAQPARRQPQARGEADAAERPPLRAQPGGLGACPGVRPAHLRPVRHRGGRSPTPTPGGCKPWERAGSSRRGT